MIRGFKRNFYKHSHCDLRKFKGGVMSPFLYYSPFHFFILWKELCHRFRMVKYIGNTLSA